MSDADAAHAVIDYARVSADDERLGRYLRKVLGGALLFYGGCCTVSAAFYYATLYGVIRTEMTYGQNHGGLGDSVNVAMCVAMAIAGPCILWGPRGLVIAAGFITRLVCVVLLLVFVCSWAWNLGTARRAAMEIDAWHWTASFISTAAYLIAPMMIGLLAKGPSFARICAAAKSD